MRNQFALYRINPLTSGKALWHKTFEEVRDMGIPVRIELYRPYHLELLEKKEPVMEIWKQIENSAEVSDVLVLNQKGEISGIHDGNRGLYGGTGAGKEKRRREACSEDHMRETRSGSESQTDSRKAQEIFSGCSHCGNKYPQIQAKKCSESYTQYVDCDDSGVLSGQSWEYTTSAGRNAGEIYHIRRNMECMR